MTPPRAVAERVKRVLDACVRSASEHGIPVISFGHSGETASVYDFLALADAVLAGEGATEKLRKELAQAREDGSGAWECLMMTREAIESWHGKEQSKGIAPMFFPEAIMNALNQAALAGQYLGRDGLNESIRERKAQRAPTPATTEET